LPKDDERRRLEALKRHAILDTEPEEPYERLVHLAGRLFGTKAALISLVDEDRQWFKARLGLDVQETPRAISFCTHAIQGSGVLVVPDAGIDPRFSDNPLVVGAPNIRFYAGAPLRTRDGYALGTLCLVDDRPRHDFGEREQHILLDLADLAIREIERRDHAEKLHVQGQQDRADLDQRLQAIKDSAPLSIITYDLDGRVTGWNPAAERIFGWRRGEVLGGPPPHAPGPVEARFEEIVDRFRDGETVIGSDTRRLRRDGSLIDCRVSIAPLKSSDDQLIGLVSFTEDITLQVAAARETQVRSERLRRQSAALEDLARDASLAEGDLPWFLPRVAEIAVRTLESSAAGIWMIDREAGKLQPAAVATRRPQSSPAAAIPLARIEDYLDLVQTERGIASEDVSADARLRGMASSREQRSSPAVALLDSPVRIGQRLEAIVCIEQYEPRKWFDDERAFVASLADFVRLVMEARGRLEALERLEIERNNAQTADRAKSRFLSTVSHELRTPLNGIIGFSEILHGEMLGPIGNDRYREYAGDILESGRSLLRVIDDIITFTRGESGAAGAESEVAVDGLVEAAIAHVALPAAAAGVVIQAEIPPELPKLRGARDSLERALTNILANAVKFSPPGARVEVEACAHDSGLSIAIADHGVGMAAVDVERAMQPFEQLDGGLDRQRGGLGLGLSLAKSIVELHDGELMLESVEGAGTTVALLFPASRLTRSFLG